MTTQQTSAADLIDFGLASRVTSRALRYSVVLPGGAMRLMTRDFSDATSLAYDRVSLETGLFSPIGAPRVMVVDRIGWAQANITSLDELLSQVMSTKSEAQGSMGLLGRATSATQLGLMFSWLSKRVLGQYDMVSADPARNGVYYVAPNIYGIERRNGFSSKEFRLWIALHEVTHHLQFSGVSWMRAYFFDLVARATALGGMDTTAITEAMTRAKETLKRGENPLAEGGIPALLAGTQMIATLREAQALMSLLEGHAEYIMSKTAPDLIPQAEHFGYVLAERRKKGSPITKFVHQALGFEAKLRQYHEGHSFIDAVVEQKGATVLTELWHSRENLPSIEEIRDPARWVRRMDGRSREADDNRALS
jgi:coenzyme F420 biosynthesis associated uncharacterized protein